MTLTAFSQSRRFVLILLALAWLSNAPFSGVAAESFSLENRIPWTTSRIQGRPDPPSRYQTAVAFPNIKMDEPLAIASATGTNRFFVAERFGKVLSFTNDPEVAKADVLLELPECALYGIATHPQFEENRFLYLSVVGTDNLEDPQGSRIARFTVSDTNPPTIDPASEKVIFYWPSGGHNGGGLKFGPDGYLYLGTGDGSGINDQKLTGQDVSTVLGKLIRIDVDHEGNGKAYRVPADNPLVGIENAREEIWAYGLRQPWRFSFDKKTGDLWLGNIGQDLWEQIYLIEPGGNYGWSVMEGSNPFHPERAHGPSPILMPTVEHNHTEFRSITGGFVYHGTRLSELTGAYLYGDYDTGKIWSFRFDRETKTVSNHGELVDSALRLIDWVEAPNGELYLLDHLSGQVSHLEPNPDFGSTTDFPRQLSETGLFASVPDHQPADGVIPYEINAEPWMDGATSERFLALPGKSQIEFDGTIYPQPAPDTPHGWKFPDGTVIVQTISIELEEGNPASRRRLETRILHHERVRGVEEMGDQLWHGYTYLWNEEQTEADLMENKHGHDIALNIRDAAAAGTERQQMWHVPARTECAVCHTVSAKYAIGLNTFQLNRDFDYGAETTNQLTAFEKLGLFSKPLPDPPQELPAIVDPTDDSASLNARAQAYLHTNCGHCHRKWGGGNGDFRLHSHLALEDMGIHEEKPKHGSFLISDARIIQPGEPQRSILFYRLAKLGAGRMPRLGSNEVDSNGLALIHQWIQQLPHDVLAAPRNVIDTNKQIENTLKSLVTVKQPSPTNRSRLEELFHSTGGAIELAHAVGQNDLSQQVRQIAIEQAVQMPPHVRDLFERFVSLDQRVKRLGNTIRPSDILSLKGDFDAGRKLFFEATDVQCRNCHKIQDKGNDLGPDLSEIGKKYNDPSRLLDTILNPSKEIDPKYRVYLVQTDDGRIHSGLVVKKDDREIILKDAKGKLIQLPVDEIEELVPQPQSMMPELLLRDMTAQQVADLTTFLSGLKPSAD